MRNLRIAIFALSSLISFVTYANTEAKVQMTMEERLAQLGGYVVYPNSQKGAVAFIDGQATLDIANDLGDILDHLRRQIPIKIDFIRGEAGAPKALKDTAKANFTVVFVNDSAQPPSMIVPEEKYAIVNFAKYTEGLKLPTDEAKYKRRCARAALKAFVLLCGGGSSRFPGHVASAQTPQELDFAQDKLPIDIQDSIKKYLGAAGVTPKKRTIYRRACQEGWAPAPTNAIQQAIWDKVKAEQAQVPTKPIKITPDMKPKGK